MDTLSILTKTAWLARHLPGGAELVRQARTRLLCGPSELTHNATHTIREIAASAHQVVATKSPESWNHLQSLGEKFCNQAAAVLGSLTATNTSEIHCCIKLIQPGDAKDRHEDIVNTFVRSSNAGHRRSDDMKSDDVHYVGDCSVWASLHSLSDGKNSWRGLPCFTCPDLCAAGDNFVCSRQDWKDRYHSTIALPIRYCSDGACRHKRLIGFLALDTRNKGCLSGVPSAFDYVTRPQAFADILNRTPVFHSLATLTDAFGMALAGIWETSDHFVVSDRVKLPIVDRSETPSIVTDENG